MKILAINFILCLMLNLTLYSQTNPKQEDIRIEQPSPPSAPEVPEAPEPSIEAIAEDDFELNINLGFNGDNSSNILRVGMVDLGISTYLDSQDNLDLSNELDYMDQRLGRSINIGIYLINIKMGFRKSEKPQNFGFSTGIKWNIVHYSLEKDYAVKRNAERFQDGINYEVPELKHNRLKANYLQVPLLLEYNSNPKKPAKSLNIAAGLAFQLLLNSNYKYKTTEGEKTKTKGDFNLSKFGTLAEVRFGYGPLNFYVQYGGRLFQDLAGPELRPINIGVNIIPR